MGKTEGKPAIYNKQKETEEQFPNSPILFRICSFSWRRKIYLIKFDFREYLFNRLGYLGNLALRELKMFIISSLSILEEFVLTGLLVFRVVVEPRISRKSAKSRKIHKIVPNTCRYNIFETLSWLLEPLTWRKLANL